MPPVLVFKLLKLKYVHELQNRGMHRIDFVHVMTKKTERSKSGHQTLNASKYHFLEKVKERKRKRETVVEAFAYIGCCALCTLLPHVIGKHMLRRL